MGGGTYGYKFVDFVLLQLNADTKKPSLKNIFRNVIKSKKFNILLLFCDIYGEIKKYQIQSINSLFTLIYILKINYYFNHKQQINFFITINNVHFSLPIRKRNLRKTFRMIL